MVKSSGRDYRFWHGVEMNPKRVKRVLMNGRSSKVHLAVDCTPDGRLSYVLCRGFPSVGEHEPIPLEIMDELKPPECAQCKKIWAKMLRQRPEHFKLL